MKQGFWSKEGLTSARVRKRVLLSATLEKSCGDKFSPLLPCWGLTRGFVHAGQMFYCHALPHPSCLISEGEASRGGSRFNVTPQPWCCGPGR